MFETVCGKGGDTLQVEIILKVKRKGLIRDSTKQPTKMDGSKFMSKGNSPGVEVCLWVFQSPLSASPTLRLSIQGNQVS